MSTQLTLHRMPGLYGVYRFEPGEKVPDMVFSAPFYSVTKTGEETSVLLPEDVISIVRDGSEGWAGLRLGETWELSTVGILSELTSILAAGGIPILALSTFDTDYLFVKEEDMPQAEALLKEKGHTVLAPEA